MTQIASYKKPINILSKRRRKKKTNKYIYIYRERERERGAKVQGFELIFIETEN